MRATGLSLLLAAALLAEADARADVLTVGQPGGDYPTIQQAVNAAIDGDIVLVRAGQYAAFAMPDRTLTVVAESPGAVQVLGQVRVQDLSAGRCVSLIDLSVRGTEERALVLANDAGSVRVRGGTWEGKDYADPWWAPVNEAVKVLSCADVSLAGCLLQGGRGTDASWTPPPGTSPGGHGLWAQQSQVSLHGCTLRGGQGGGDDVGESYPGREGGHGAWVQGGFLYVSDCEFFGGKGGRGGDEDGCVPFGDPAEDGGDGGDGLRLSGVAHAELLAFQGSGGTGGVGGYGWCGPNGSPGAPGIPLRLEQQATASTLPFAPRRLDAPGLWRGGVPVTLTVEGAPGDVAVLVASPTTGFHFLPSRKGVALLGGGMLALVPLGRLDASGRLQATFAPFGPIPPAEGIVRRLQAWTASATTGAHLTGPLTVALVDPAF